MKYFVFSTSTRALIFVTLLLSNVACTKTPDTISQADQSSLRYLSSGSVVGIEGGYNNHTWLGIPFAKAPVGDLRWKAPIPNVLGSETLLANKHGAPCSQPGGSVGGVAGERGSITGSEDCLYLSVYSPKWAVDQIPSEEAVLPIMVWLHGGSNAHGAGSLYDGSRLASEQNVIVVSVNYRLGPMGWFMHPSLNSVGSLEDQSGNYGTLDILQALKWVQENGQAFGGDTNNVTLFGESAGAFNILSLMLSPLSEGLFQKAISQSGGININSVELASNYMDQEDAGHEYSGLQVDLYLHVQDGSATDLAQARKLVSSQSGADRAAYLRNKSTDEIYDAYKFGRSEGRARGPRTFGDGHVLPTEDPYQLFAQPDKHLNIPLLIGTNRDEMKLYLYGNSEFVDTYFSIYAVVKNDEIYDATSDYLTRMWKYNGVDRVADALYKSGQRQLADGKDAAGVWAYRFDWDELARPMGMQLDKLIGAGHGLEIPFVFGFTSKDKIWSRMYDDSNQNSREALSKVMRSYWAEFAYHGDPNKGQAEEQLDWMAWDGESLEGEKFIILDSTLDAGVRMSNKAVSLAGIAKDIAGDERLSSKETKCAMFAGLMRGNQKFWPANDYSNHLGGACVQYPVSGQ
ncbi:MAG: para-nitrobenzyl esterase [Candidatus Azotimanducaceae bacterium]|jgi:para-nitrobenzyl esterase